MIRAKQIYIILLAMVVSVIAVRLILPYKIPQGKVVMPELSYEYKVGSDEDLLKQVFAHNLWSRSRLPLTADDGFSLSENQQNTGDGPVSEPKGNGSWKLVGVSNAQEPPFAIIESEQVVENYIKGDLLPDGSTVDEILDYGIQTIKLGKNERFYLFGKE